MSVLQKQVSVLILLTKWVSWFIAVSLVFVLVSISNKVSWWIQVDFALLSFTICTGFLWFQGNAAGCFNVPLGWGFQQQEMGSLGCSLHATGVLALGHGDSFWEVRTVCRSASLGSRCLSSSAGLYFCARLFRASADYSYGWGYFVWVQSRRTNETFLVLHTGHRDETVTRKL